MLIIDGFESHMTIPLIHENILFCLQPHLTRSLNVNVFQLSKHYHNKVIKEAVRLGETKFGSLKFLAASQRSRIRIFKTSSLKHSR